jgi:hypothetical protein
MMYTDSEHEAIDMMNAMKMATGSKPYEDKATRKETRYEKWKRNKKAKSGWTIWCCCFKKPVTANEPPEETQHINTTPLII